MLLKRSKVLFYSLDCHLYTLAVFKLFFALKICFLVKIGLKVIANGNYMSMTYSSATAAAGATAA